MSNNLAKKYIDGQTNILLELMPQIGMLLQNSGQYILADANSKTRKELEPKNFNNFMYKIKTIATEGTINTVYDNYALLLKKMKILQNMVDNNPDIFTKNENELENMFVNLMLLQKDD